MPSSRLGNNNNNTHTHSCGLLLQVPGSLLEVEVALLVRPAGAESDADKGGPRSALEQQD